MLNFVDRSGNSNFWDEKTAKSETVKRLVTLISPFAAHGTVQNAYNAVDAMAIFALKMPK